MSDAAASTSTAGNANSDLIDGLEIIDALNLASHDHLVDMPRTACPQCKRHRRYFCYSCGIPLGDASLIPHVDLPVKLDVVFHASECDGKATSVHARVLCGHDQVRHFVFPELAKYDAATDVILFPADNAVFLDEIPEDEFRKIQRVLVLDCQWHVVKRLERHENLAGLRRVKIRNYSTTFWRYQSVGPECLATIEAIYYFYREHGTRALSGQYDGRYDNLLYYYKFFYDLIQHKYKTEGRPFTVRHTDPNYVRHDRQVQIAAVTQIPINDNGKPVRLPNAVADSTNEPGEKDEQDEQDSKRPRVNHGMSSSS